MKSLIGKKLLILPDKSLKFNWKKRRIGEIVDEDYETFSHGITFFLKIEKIKGLVTLSDLDLIYGLKNKILIPYDDD